MSYWSGGAKRAYHHTAPVNTLYALHESLRLLATEGLEQAWARHQAMHQQLKQGLHRPVRTRMPGGVAGVDQII